MTEFSPDPSIRQPAIAGLLYPKDAAALRETAGRLLDSVRIEGTASAPPKALIVPHAGYPYSGAVAAAAYALLEPLRQRVNRVVLIGPSRRVYVQRIALRRAQIFATPYRDRPSEFRRHVGKCESYRRLRGLCSWNARHS